MLVVSAQILEVALGGGDEEIALRAISGWMSEGCFEVAKKRNGVERHLNADRRGELGPDTAHAFSGGAFALGGFALQDHDVAAAGGCELVGDAGSDNAAADDDYVCC